jgi:hypothetical protein
MTQSQLGRASDKHLTQILSFEYHGILLSNRNEHTIKPITTWLHLKCIMLTEQKETWKTTYHMIPFI